MIAWPSNSCTTVVVSATKHSEDNASVSDRKRLYHEALSAVQEDWKAIARTPVKDMAANNHEIALAAVMQCGAALRYLGPELVADQSIAAAAVACNGLALRYVAEELQSDRQIVLTAVSSCGLALQYAASHLRDDREIVSAAVSTSGHALKYASQRLRSDPDVVLAGVSSSGHALQFAGEELRNSRFIVMTAIANSPESLRYASEAIQQDEAVLQEVLIQLPPNFVLLRLNTISGRSCVVVRECNYASTDKEACLALELVLAKVCASQLGLLRSDRATLELVLLGCSSLPHFSVYLWPKLRSGCINEIQVLQRALGKA
mmetsp:Transcript_65700/g.157034  ORF Transcript_65700/g.157034 Transcript_65700/m.157034 type:complete len:318 (-) Transcript_65700:117-1070(-)